ncbi:hypothetical protein [Brevibacterium marinum]|uniref:ABC-type branched-subunit amino acid transport system ATPase component n=1 Tax=Brevibacterium marinum TaxID=418643 RepID=A0A846RXZ1_9MICO|nr:hypothetical protein [Brevibacterium marinum]NJC55533.1 ABC-type branched-subunit amino acid transport system ATPase component [Brevibacterium marinum]
MTEETRPSEDTPVLSFTGIRKQFFGVEVLHDIAIEVRAGTVHGLVGENSAAEAVVSIRGLLWMRAGVSFDAAFSNQSS